MSSAKVVFRIFFLLLGNFVFQMRESGACFNTGAIEFQNTFRAKMLTEDSVWRMSEKFHVYNSTQDSVVYKVSDLVGKFFSRNKFSDRSLTEGILILSAKPSVFGAWEYEELNEANETNGNETQSWKEISIGDENILSKFAVPHWYTGAVDIERSCQSICDEATFPHHNISKECQEILLQNDSQLFIPHSKYIRFKRRRKFWNYFESLEKTKIIFQPVYRTHIESIESGLPNNDTLSENQFSDFAILKAELKDCSGEPILQQPKWLDICGVCGGDGSSCKICDRGEILYRGDCKGIEELLSLEESTALHDFSQKENTNFSKKSLLKVRSIEDDDLESKDLENSVYIDSFNEREKLNSFYRKFNGPKQPMLNLHTMLQMKMGYIEIEGPSAVYADIETLLQVHPTSWKFRSTRFTLNWKYYWHVNGPLRKGLDWIQQGAKMIIGKGVLQPLKAYNVTSFMENESEPGIIYVVSKLLKVHSRGVKAELKISHGMVDSRTLLRFDANSSIDFDNKNSQSFLRFYWRCNSITTNTLCYNCAMEAPEVPVPESRNFRNSLKQNALKIDKDCLTPGLYAWSVTVFNLYSSASVTATIEVLSNTIESEFKSKKSTTGNSGESFKIVSTSSKSSLVNSEIESFEQNKSYRSSLEILQSIEINLTVTPKTAPENTIGNFFTFEISITFPPKADAGLLQRMIYTIGYTLNSSNKDIFWLQTSSLLVNTSWDYLPSGGEVIPVVKICLGADCTKTYFSLVKTQRSEFDSLSPSLENNIRKTFERKICNMETNGAMTYMNTAIISARHFGDQILENKLFPVFSKSIDFYSQVIAEGLRFSYAKQKRVSNTAVNTNGTILSYNIMKLLARYILKIHLLKNRSSVLSNFTISNITCSKIARMKRNLIQNGTSKQKNHEESVEKVSNEREILVLDVKTAVTEKCVTLRNSSISDKEVKGDYKIEVEYVKDLRMDSSGSFHRLLDIKDANNITFLLIDFGYFLRRYFSDCGNGKKKMCHEICFSTVEFLDEESKQQEAHLKNSMWGAMVYLMNPNTKEIVNLSAANFGPVLLEFNINEISLNRSAECRVWDEENKDSKDVCDAVVVHKNDSRILQCFCPYFGYFKLLETEPPKVENTSLKYMPYQFSIINPDYNLTTGNIRRIFEVSLAKQLARILNISDVQVEGLEEIFGSLIVSVKLGDNFRNGGQKNGSKTLEAMVQLLDDKITTGSLVLMDFENRPLNISLSSVTRRVAEEMNLVLGIIIGSILVIGIVTFSVSSFRKYRQEKLDSVRPIKPNHIIDGVQDVDKFDNCNYVSIEEIRPDVTYDGIASIDTSDITIERITSMSDSRSNNLTRSSMYTKGNLNDINYPPGETVCSVNVTNASGEYKISTFPNAVTN